LLVGIAGTWLFLTVALAAAAWIVWSGPGFAIGSSAIGSSIGGVTDTGPLQWFTNLGISHPGTQVAWLQFFGRNVSEKEVHLKSASIRSAYKGTELELKVVAEKEFVPVSQINLIPAGAPIELVAHFNPPLPDQEFLSTWSRFNLVIVDDTREYRLPFTEGTIAVFFPGMVGPHVTKKSPSNP
jgi:hypothetical protein